MSIRRLIFWAIAIIFALIPVNWFRLWLAGDLSKDSTVSQTAIGTLICWAISAGIVYLLIFTAKRSAKEKAKAQQELDALVAAPLSVIQPTTAILKPDEKAYCSASADLMETHTVGFKAGSSGVSVRVAKGVTLRTSGIRGHAVKGQVSVSRGELVVTDKRVLFSGDQKSFSIPLTSLLNVTNYTDGIALGDSRTTRTLQIKDKQQGTKFAVVLNKVLQH